MAVLETVYGPPLRGQFDPRFSTSIFEDFYNFGQLTGGLTKVVSGAGAAVSALAAPISNPGWVSLVTGTTATGRASVATDLTLLGVGTGLGALHAEGNVTFTLLSTGVQRFQYQAGFSDQALSDLAVAGLILRYSHDVNAGRFAWTCMGTGGGVMTSFDTTIAMAVDTLYTWTVDVAADGRSAVCGLISNAGETNTTTILDPNGLGEILPTPGADTFAFSPGQMIKTVGTGSRSAGIDYGYFNFNFSAQRGTF